MFIFVSLVGLGDRRPPELTQIVGFVQKSTGVSGFHQCGASVQHTTGCPGLPGLLFVCSCQASTCHTHLIPISFKSARLLCVARSTIWTGVAHNSAGHNAVSLCRLSPQQGWRTSYSMRDSFKPMHEKNLKSAGQLSPVTLNVLYRNCGGNSGHKHRWGQLMWAGISIQQCQLARTTRRLTWLTRNHFLPSFCGNLRSRRRSWTLLSRQDSDSWP